MDGLMIGCAVRFTMVNGQAEHLFTWPREELLGQPVEVVPEAACADHPDQRDRYFTRPTFPAEISLSSFPTPDGLVVSAAIRASPPATAALAVKA